MTSRLGEIFTTLETRFRAAGFEVPEIEAAYLISDVVGIRHTLLRMHADRPVPTHERDRIQEYAVRRLNHEPWQYIVGHAPFRQLDLAVGPGCLIPRPETEVLLDFVFPTLPRNACVCELGTGSGAIALSLASERPDTTVYASEISPAALFWAERNARALRLENVRMLSGDLFSPFDGLRFDCVVANLPYIPLDARADLPANVRDYEPDCALFAPENGLSLIRRSLMDAPRYLTDGGRLFFEIGEEQGAVLLREVERTGFYRTARILPDQYGADRFLFAER